MQYELASIDGVARMILILALLYFAMRLLGRLFKPAANPQSGQARGARRDANRPEGEVRIEYTDKKKEKNKDQHPKGGDYIDFEELDKPEK